MEPNTACDILLKEISGPGFVQRYIHSLGVKKISIANTEREIQNDAQIKYKNSGTTNEMVKLLTIAHQQHILSKNSYAFLWEKMIATVTGPDRIKGMLPKGTPVAHRTGTANDAYNDAGIISLPNGDYLAIAIFISDAKAYPESCNLVIAKIAKVAWDHYSSIAGN